MKIIGLTGSIGMGKSGVATMLRALRIPVFDADKTIHRLYTHPVVARILALTFPDAVKKGVIDRKKLGEIVFENPALRARLTAILYPALAVEEQQFVKAMARRGVKEIVLDIPLLFEAGGAARTDAVMVADAPAFIQRHRALKRANMTPQKLASVLSVQMPNKMKCLMADKVLQTGCHRGVTLRQLKAALSSMQQKLARRRGVWNNFVYARNRR